MNYNSEQATRVPDETNQFLLNKKVNRSKICVVLIDPMTLSRESIAYALRQGARDFLTFGLPSSVDFHKIPHVDVVLFNTKKSPLTDQWAMDQINEIRRHDDPPVLVISEAGDIKTAVQTVAKGLRGFIPTTVEIDMLVAAIRVVLAGGIFFPQSIITDYLQHVGDHDADDQVTYLGLTQRERAIAERIREGKINKRIAWELSISESTVKVHIRHIMRKLNASNRTQVAFMTQQPALLLKS